MFQRRRLIAGCFVLWMCAASSATAGIIIFDNSNQKKSGLQVIAPQDGTNGWWAQGFTAPGTDISLNTATFLLANPDEADASFDIKLYLSGDSPTGPIPVGASLATVYSGTVGKFSSPFTVNGLDIPLIADTSYFLAVEVTAGNLDWQYTNESTGPNAFNYVVAGEWTGVNDTPLQMKLESNYVPEPSTLALTGVASGCLWCVRRFRRRKS